MDPGFVRGQADNLPKVDSLMVAEYFANSTNFTTAEIRGAKEQRSGLSIYGDSAVGYVQLKREQSQCTVKCKITPEHRVRNKAYTVELIVKEEEEKIISVQCLDCAASLGGCKHAVAFLMWMQRKSEEPAPTSVECYWKRSKLANVGTSQFAESKHFGAIALPQPSSFDFRNDVVSIGRAQNSSAQIVQQFTVVQPPKTIGLYNLMLQFVSNGGSEACDFLEFASREITAEMIVNVEQETVLQSDSPLWHDMRYGRSTASKSYDAMHCKTVGVLVEQIVGVTKIRDTVAMARGRKLEERVKEVVENQMNMKFSKSGLVLLKEHAIIGASPDATSENALVEIKCPLYDRTVSNYITKQFELTAKCKAQVQMQMFICKKSLCLFCVADPQFDSNEKVFVIYEQFDRTFAENIVSKCEAFWIRNIFPIMLSSARRALL